MTLKSKMAMRVSKAVMLPTVTMAVVSSVLLAGCAVGPTHQPPDAAATANAERWYAPIPHGGATATLTSFWQQWNDPALIALINAAQKNNTSIEQASARIAQARASATIAGSSALPNASAETSLARGNQGSGVASVFSGSLQAAWELDLFGANRRGREAADARLSARTLDWHDARVSIAAEVATAYASLRINQLLFTGFDTDTKSRSETARLTKLKTEAGFEAPANSALAQAAVNEAATRVASQRAEIDLSVKALVALTGMTEPEVRRYTDVVATDVPKPPTLSQLALPASALAQRPDLASLERELAAAIADIGAAEADRYPKISLTGSIGYSATRAFGMTADGATWGFGPSISIPVFDAGRRAANVELSKARHAELTANYKAAATRAVREVEEALTRIESVRARETDLNASLANYRVFATAAEARLKAGVGSVLELEDARRAVLGAQVSVLSLERERANAWISLYRAVGGGWTK
jgi:outer membrane protein, multidrug efflux system